MATSFSVSDIIADVARSCNVPTFSTTTSVTLAQVTYKLVQSARSLSALFRQKFGDDRDYLNQASLTVQAGIGLTSLPSDCGEVQAILWVKTASDWRLLDPAQLDDYESAQLDDLRTWSDQPAPRYVLEGNIIRFLPASSVAETVVVLYTSHLNITGETSFLSRLDADRWLTLDVSSWVLRSTGRTEESQLVTLERDALSKELFAVDRERDMYAVDTVRDTRSRRMSNLRRNRWED